MFKDSWSSIGFFCAEILENVIKIVSIRNKDLILNLSKKNLDMLLSFCLFQNISYKIRAHIVNTLE